jgi:hypothetical protein
VGAQPGGEGEALDALFPKGIASPGSASAGCCEELVTPDPLKPITLWLNHFTVAKFSNQAISHISC